MTRPSLFLRPEFATQRPVGDKEVILLHDEGADVSCRHACKRPLELGRSAYLGEMKSQSQAAGSGIHLG